MTAFAGTSTIYESDTGASIVANSPYEYKEILVTLDDTADYTDTIAITLANYGISTLWIVKGYTHTIEGSHIIEEAPTTSVASGVLTITVGGSTDNKFRVFLVGGI